MNTPAPSIPSPPVTDHGTGAEPALTVIGAGPVGIRLVEELLRRGYTSPIRLFGDEPCEPYQRIKLSSLLAGEIRLDDVYLGLSPDFQRQVDVRLGLRIAFIDREKQQIRDTLGQWHAYSRLVLATGSRAFIPQIPGTRLNGVYSFRSLSDTESLLARTARSRRLIVAGGGLLGLEGARALQRGHCEVTVVQQAPWLMNRQLDEAAAERLAERLRGRGIRILTGSGLGAILGESQVEGIQLRNGTQLPCDTVLLATGIRANLELAREAGLRVASGVVVDDGLTTSDPLIHAIGECAEHQGQHYGLVAPGYEQAAVLAERLCGGQAHYRGSLSLARLKVAGEQVFSMGDAADPPRRPRIQSIQWQTEDAPGAHYRKLVIERGRLIGAIGLGEQPESARLQEAIRQSRRVWPWQRWRFRRTGEVWGTTDQPSVADWPATAIICQCTGVTRGQLAQVITSSPGPVGVSTLTACTGAGGVCGSCRPLLGELCGAAPTEAPESVRRAGWLLPSALISLMVLLLWISPLGLTPASSIDDMTWIEQLSNDSLGKQITGFTMLGLTVLTLLLSLRKRWRRFAWLDYPVWRVVHAVLGAMAVAVTLLHTGLQAGNGLNAGLLVNFLGLIGLGAMTALVVALPTSERAPSQRLVQRSLQWGHVVLAWPLPALLALHVLTVYYY